MSRFARERRTFFVEEPVLGGDAPQMRVTEQGGVSIVVPHLPGGLDRDEEAAATRRLLDAFLRERAIADFVLWYYTPMALDFTRHLRPTAVVYDCMDELTGFKGAPPALGERENELFARADAVFTGGHSLYEAKRRRHPNVHAVPSSVDADHFAKARGVVVEPRSQAALPRPRLGFFGVIDERMDLDLVARAADTHPEWQIILVGPIAKIDPASLPARPNVHHLGAQRYEALPAFVAGWDVAIMPFAANASTRFISPTKTLEYLAAGKPVVSTPIADVVHPYGDLGVVRIGEGGSFVREIEAALAEDPAPRRAAADAFVAQTSWDETWARMSRVLDEAVAQSRARALSSAAAE